MAGRGLCFFFSLSLQLALIDFGQKGIIEFPILHADAELRAGRQTAQHFGLRRTSQSTNARRAEYI
jgi:hypothetical protein